MSTYCNAESKLGVVEGGRDVLDDVGLIDSDGENLSLAVDTDDTTGFSVWCSHKDGLSATGHQSQVRLKTVRRNYRLVFYHT
jgi:hypothetical protein